MAFGKATTATGSTCSTTCGLAADPRRGASPVSDQSSMRWRSPATDALPEHELRELLGIEARRRLRLLHRPPPRRADRGSARRARPPPVTRAIAAPGRRNRRHVESACGGGPSGRPRVRGRDSAGQGRRAKSAPSGGAASSTRSGSTTARDVLRGWLMRDRLSAATSRGFSGRPRPRRTGRALQDQPGDQIRQQSCWRSRAPAASPPDELDQIINEQDLEQQLFTDPLQVTELLERYYHEQGYLVASIEQPRYEFMATRGARRPRGR